VDLCRKMVDVILDSFLSDVFMAARSGTKSMTVWTWVPTTHISCCCRLKVQSRYDYIVTYWRS